MRQAKTSGSEEMLALTQPPFTITGFSPSIILSFNSLLRYTLRALYFNFWNYTIEKQGIGNKTTPELQLGSREN